MNILVRRTGALGDVVLATPVLRRLRRENPKATIFVQTGYGSVFEHNPNVDKVLDPRGLLTCPYDPATMENAASWLYSEGYFDQVVALDLAYEKRPDMHIVEAYMQEAFGDPGTPRDRQQELIFDRTPMFKPGGRYVAVHAARAGWRNRTLPSATWVEVIRGLRAEGFWPILVGTPRDDLPGVECPRFLVPDVRAQARLINSCVCFVGSDSGLLHVAGATDTPIVGVFTCARPEYRLPWRNGVLGDRCAAVQPDMPCIGCLARQPVPATVETCERGDVACVNLVGAGSIIKAVRCWA